jgi:transcriptional regulator with XRE-family HTH domain
MGDHGECRLGGKMSIQGDLIVFNRKKLKMKQETLAKKLRVLPQYLGQIELGYTTLPAKYIRAICSALNISFESFCQAAAEDFYEKLKTKARSK